MILEIGPTLDQVLRFALIVYLCVKLYIGTISIYISEREARQSESEDQMEVV